MLELGGSAGRGLRCRNAPLTNRAGRRAWEIMCFQGREAERAVGLGIRCNSWGFIALVYYYYPFEDRVVLLQFP